MDEKQNFAAGVFRKDVRELTNDEHDLARRIKDTAEELYNLIAETPTSREQALAKTKLEESIMWAIKGLTH